MCMAAGNVSLDDWHLFTWSFGCTGVLLPSWPPVSWIARLLITSLRFMLDWVPEPVCQTYSGKSSSSSPRITSSQTCSIRPDIQSGSRPWWPLTVAAAFFT